MIELEKEFGKIQLGFSQLPQDMPTHVKKKGDPLWQKLLEVLTFSPNKMIRFKEMIDQA